MPTAHSASAPTTRYWMRMQWEAQFMPCAAEFLDESMAATTPRRRSGSSTLCPTLAAPPIGMCAECQ